jgi:plasmid stabilization system protein ParE
MAKKRRVVYSGIAHEQILAIMFYITEKGYPETSLKFCDLLYEFGSSLASFPEKFPLCHREPFQKRQLRCAPFKNYVFIYSVGESSITILGIIHSGRLK